MRTAAIAILALSLVAIPAAAEPNTQTGSGLAPLDCVTVAVQAGTGFELTSPEGGDWDIYFNDADETAFANVGDEAGTVPEGATEADVCAWSSTTAPNAGTGLEWVVVVPGETSFEYTDGL